MAGFYSNTCTYVDCGRNFANLHELIYHIEDEHIDFDPAVLAANERLRPLCVPLSYVLKFSTMCPKEKQIKEETDTIKSEEQISVDSDDSWNEDNGSDAMNSKDPLDPNYQCRRDSGRLKRFVCPIPGCNKRYKNINGIKYHAKNGHDGKKSPIKPKKAHKCQCGKSYKTVQGLKAHATAHKEMTSFQRNQLPHPQMLPTSKLSHMFNKLYIKNEMMSGNVSNMIKSEVFSEDILTYTYLEQDPKLSDTIEAESNNFGLLTTGNINNTGFSFNEPIIEQFVVGENQNYPQPFVYRK